MLADDNRISMRLLAPVARADRRSARVCGRRQQRPEFPRADRCRKQTKDIDRTLGVLSGIIQLAPSEIERIRRDIARHRRFVPATIRENLTWDQVSMIEVNAPEPAGRDHRCGRGAVLSAVGTRRRILIGYVGAVNESELDDDNPGAGRCPAFKIGKSGVEKSRDEDLRRPPPATSEMEVNAYGRTIRELSRADTGERGLKVTLTIDSELQLARA